MSKEVLSAAVDGAATAQQWDDLLTAMESDPALKADWDRQWASRDAREGVALGAGADFCAHVMAAIGEQTPLPSRVVPLVRPAALPAPRRARQWQTFVPLSAAAGVVAAVLVVGGLRQFGAGSTPAPLAVAAAPVVAVVPATVEHPTVALSEAEKTQLLSAYAMEHSNSLAERGMGGTLANARFAARTADYRPDGQ